MRLIDADTLEKDLKSVTLSNGTLINTNTMIALINKYPTAYDINNVVKELEEVAYVSEDINSFVDLEDAIEIVKQGSVSDDVCEWIKYDYRTMCPKNHDVKNPYWRIPMDMDKLKYCPCCGKKIKVVE